MPVMNLTIRQKYGALQSALHYARDRRKSEMEEALELARTQSLELGIPLAPRVEEVIRDVYDRYWLIYEAD